MSIIAGRQRTALTRQRCAFLPRIRCTQKYSTHCSTVGNPVRIPKFRRFVPIFLDFGRGNQLHMFACHVPPTGFGQIWSNRPPWNKGGMFFWCIWLCLGSSQKQNRGDWLVPNGKFNPTLYISHQPLHPGKLTFNPKKMQFPSAETHLPNPLLLKNAHKKTQFLLVPHAFGRCLWFYPAPVSQALLKSCKPVFPTCQRPPTMQVSLVRGLPRT